MRISFAPRHTQASPGYRWLLIPMMKIFVQSRVLIMQDKSQTFTDYRIGYTCAMNNCLDFAQQNTALIHNVSSLLVFE
jgi:hypothetical protein